MNTYFSDRVGFYFCPENPNNSKLINTNHDNGYEFYKCACIEQKRVFQSCGYATNVRNDFIEHVQREHSHTNLICIYCHLKDSKKLKHFRKPITLAIHMDKFHTNQHFQCNSCSYRAITADHVNLHQLFCHHQSSLCSENRKIIYCNISQNETTNLTLKYFYDKYKIDRNTETNCQFQCLYCDCCWDVFQELIQHMVRFHPEYPLLYYFSRQNEIHLDQNISEFSTINGDHLDDDSDNDVNIQFCCFFCDNKFLTKIAIRKHLIEHLFDSTEKNRDEFFNNWIDSFILNQHSYREFYPECPICLKLVVNGENNDHRRLCSNQKAHYIEHSSYKKYKCILCYKDKREDYWLPELYHHITDHVHTIHPEKINLELKNILMDYSANNEDLIEYFDDDNLEALKRLERQYQKNLSSFSSKKKLIK